MYVERIHQKSTFLFNLHLTFFIPLKERLSSDKKNLYVFAKSKKKIYRYIYIHVQCIRTCKCVRIGKKISLPAA